MEKSQADLEKGQMDKFLATSLQKIVKDAPGKKNARLRESCTSTLG